MPANHYIVLASADSFIGMDGNQIHYVYTTEVNLPDTKPGSVSAFDFDRFPRHVVSLVMQGGSSEQAFGISYLFNHVRYNADSKWIRRLPVSYGGELLFLQHDYNEISNKNIEP
jgi:hypothetical protein